MRARPTARRLGVAIATIGLVAVLTGCDDPPTTVTTAINYDCQIKSNNILVPNTTGALAGTYDTTGPQAVAPGGELVLEVAPQPFTVDGTNTGGGSITQISDVVWKVTIPANASLTSHTISDWVNVGSGTPTSTVSGGSIVVTVPGPIPANTDATFPTVTMNLTATGGAGSRIEPKVAGSSYGSPGLTLNSRVTGTILGTLNPSLACFPSPSPVLHSTLISNDVNAPKITIASPVADQSIVQGTTVLADFTCDDGTGVGVASCVGTVADGAAINTSTLGAKTFTVTATDNEGKVGSLTVNYTVVPA